MPSPRSLGHRITAGCLLVTPALLFGYGTVRLLDPTHSPGPVWTVSHLCYLGGFLTLGAAAIAAFRLMAEHRPVVRRIGGAAVLISWLGSLCGVGQALIDLIAAANAPDKAHRAVVATRLRHAIPGSTQLFYGLGPALSNLAVIAVLALAATIPPRRLPWWPPVLALGASLLPSLTLDLIPVAALVVALALWPAYRQLSALDRGRAPAGTDSSGTTSRIIARAGRSWWRRGESNP